MTNERINQIFAAICAVSALASVVLTTYQQIFSAQQETARFAREENREKRDICFATNAAMWRYFDEISISELEILAERIAPTENFVSFREKVFGIPEATNKFDDNQFSDSLGGGTGVTEKISDRLRVKAQSRRQFNSARSEFLTSAAKLDAFSTIAETAKIKELAETLQSIEQDFEDFRIGKYDKIKSISNKVVNDRNLAYFTALMLDDAFLKAKHFDDICQTKDAAKK